MRRALLCLPAGIVLGLVVGHAAEVLAGGFGHLVKMLANLVGGAL